MADVIYPSNAELTEVSQDLMPRLQAGRVTFDFFPIVTQDAWLLIWEQLDNFQGLQYARGLNGQPTRIKKTGAKRFQMQPGVYGEYEYIDEEELTIRRQYGSFNAPVNLTDLVSTANVKLLQRELDRIEAIIWTLLTTGTFAVTGPTGAIVHTDIFTMKTQTPLNGAWSTTATSTPLADLRATALLGRGTSANFGAGAKVYVNQVTANNIIANTNAADFGGKRFGLGTLNNLNDVNTLLTMDGLANIAVYDQGYIDETGTFQTFIPNAKAVVIGQRPGGQVLGNYRLVRNANNEGFGPGPYSMVVDSLDDGPPRNIAVHRGHSGGPVLFFGTAIVQMNV
jgi:hypothetical protein